MNSLKHKIKWFFKREKPCVTHTAHGHDLERDGFRTNLYYSLTCKVCGERFCMSKLGLERMQ